MPTFNVEFVFDYMVIIAHVAPDFEADVHEDDIAEMAANNIKQEYGIDIEKLDAYIQDIIVHEVD